MLVVAAGGEGDLRQNEVILGAGQRGVQHQDVALERKEKGDFMSNNSMSWVTIKSKASFKSF